MIAYRVSGTAQSGALTWTVEGEIHQPVLECYDDIMHEVFQRLTSGNATFGQPGVGGCRGPYKITSVILEAQ